MRTKALLLAAVFGALGLASSMAQVYSVNVVGYVNTTLKPGYNLIANPLQGASTKVDQLFPAIDDLTVFKYGGGAYAIATVIPGIGWDFGGGTAFDIAPGDGCFVNVPGTANLTVTFVGDVLQGTLNNALPKGLSMKSSIVPQSGLLVTALGFPAVDDDTIYLWNNTKTPPGYDIYNNIPGIGWDPAEPTVAVGQAFFVSKAAATTWTRTFTVQ